MKKISCVIADDEHLAREILLSYAGKINYLGVKAVCRNGTDVFNIITQQSIDLIFLDIKMPQLSGIELMRSGMTLPPVILTTAYSEFAIESYSFPVVDYLLKPIAFERFLKAVQKYISLHRTDLNDPMMDKTVLNKDSSFLYLKADKKMVKVFHRDILWIEGMKDYIIVQTVNSKIITHQTLTSLEEKLPQFSFIRVHRSFMVALEHITAFTPKTIEIGDKEIPVGDTYSKITFERLQSESKP